MSIALDCKILALEELRNKYVGCKVKSILRGGVHSIRTIEKGEFVPFIFNGGYILSKFEKIYTREETIKNLVLII